MRTSAELLKLRYARLMVSQKTDLVCQGAGNGVIPLESALAITDRYSSKLISIVNELRSIGERIADCVLYELVDAISEPAVVESLIREECRLAGLHIKFSVESNVGFSDASAIMLECDARDAECCLLILNRYVKVERPFALSDLEYLDDDACSVYGIEDAVAASNYLNHHKLKLISINSSRNTDISVVL